MANNEYPRKQESIQDYLLMAKEIAKTEKELSIERWDYVTICRTGDKEGDSIRPWHRPCGNRWHSWM